LEASQAETRKYSTELFKLKTQYEESQEQIESLRKENRSLADEIKVCCLYFHLSHILSFSLSFRISSINSVKEERSKSHIIFNYISRHFQFYSVHEVEKARKRAELEKEELQEALEEAESKLEQEEAKVIRVQMELSVVRQEIDKRIHEKEEEFESTRRNHARALESMQASLEAENRAKNEAFKQKKKLETDVNELEVALDHANRTNADLQKSLKRLQESITDLQKQVEDEQQSRDEAREIALTAERRANSIIGELEELRTALEQAERSRKAAENELHEAADRISELSTVGANLASSRRQLESTIATMQADLDEAVAELRNSEERAKTATADAVKLTEELRQEQEHSQHAERLRKGFEQQIKDLQARLNEAEGNALKGGKRVISKLEQRVSLFIFILQVFHFFLNLDS
jgi:chromosome segregation ATPase